eukprot:jgi/Chlat1/1611/Chrsp127S01873
MLLAGQAVTAALVAAVGRRVVGGSFVRPGRRGRPPAAAAYQQVATCQADSGVGVGVGVAHAMVTQLWLAAASPGEAEVARSLLLQEPPSLPEGVELRLEGRPESAFNSDKYFAALAPTLNEQQTTENNNKGVGFMTPTGLPTLGRALLVAARLPSTQTILQENIKSFPPGTVCIADVQESGRGRGDNVWTSPPGCLMFSCTSFVADGRTLPFLQYLVSLAVVKAARSATERVYTHPADIKIKWPNDIYSNDGQKIGGVLCHSTFSAWHRHFRVTMGVGFNVSNTEPTTCLNKLCDPGFKHGNAGGVEREELLAEIVSELQSMLRVFDTEGFTPFQDEYLQYWLHTGQKVHLEEDSEKGIHSKVELEVQGLAKSGYLLATDAAGKPFELHPDGNSLDFFKGLVRKKLQESQGGQT